MSDLYSELIDHVGYLVYRKTQVDYIDVDERWTEEELAQIKPCIIHLIMGEYNAAFKGLSDKRRGQIEVRIAAGYLDEEDELKDRPLPCRSHMWFRRRIANERANRSAGKSTMSYN